MKIRSIHEIQNLMVDFGRGGDLFLISSLTITIVEYSRFKGQSSSFPTGSTIAGVPVGGLDAAAAVTRVEEVYSLPLDLVIEDHTIAASPVDLGFEMDPFSLVQAALDEVQTSGYWSSLWNRISSEAVTVPLDATVNSETLRNYLVQEIEPAIPRPAHHSPRSPTPPTLP